MRACLDSAPDTPRPVSAPPLPWSTRRTTTSPPRPTNTSPRRTRIWPLGKTQSFSRPGPPAETPPSIWARSRSSPLVSSWAPIVGQRSRISCPIRGVDYGVGVLRHGRHGRPAFLPPLSACCRTHSLILTSTHPKRRPCQPVMSTLVLFGAGRTQFSVFPGKKETICCLDVRNNLFVKFRARNSKGAAKGLFF